jgi:hypothetical protein
VRCFPAACHRYRREHYAGNPGNPGGRAIRAARAQAATRPRPPTCKPTRRLAAKQNVFDVELDPNGTFTVGEYGTVNDPELFQAMRAYSPYHNVKDGTAYPAVLLTVGESDSFANTTPQTPQTS